MRRIFWIFLILCLFTLSIAEAQGLKAGFAKRDITPPDPIPMWGYGARHALPATGTLDPLFAKALVIEAGGSKLALVGLDLGRGPTYRMMDAILEAVKEQSGVDFAMMVGSHTHHGPVIELLDQPGQGQGKYDDAVAYADSLIDHLTAVINEAAANTVDAKMGWAIEDTDLNRNRHTKIEPKPRDPELAVVRWDTLDGTPIAIMANLAAHSTIHSVMDRQWTSEWPGHMQMKVEDELNVPCFFMQGAAGDLSPNTSGERRGISGFGQAVAAKVLELNERIETRLPETPAILGRYDEFTYPSRVDFTNKAVLGAYKMAFFPELMALLEEVPDNQVTVRLCTMVLNNELALVGGSGEFFSDLSVRLKRESVAPTTLFFGYCNGHTMYVPTVRGAEEGGYGADPLVAWVPPHAGDEIIAKALANIAEFIE
jgi:neutral ceramidase